MSSSNTETLGFCLDDEGCCLTIPYVSHVHATDRTRDCLPAGRSVQFSASIEVSFAAATTSTQSTCRALTFLTPFSSVRCSAWTNLLTHSLTQCFIICLQPANIRVSRTDRQTSSPLSPLPLAHSFITMLSTTACSLASFTDDIFSWSLQKIQPSSPPPCLRCAPAHLSACLMPADFVAVHLASPPLILLTPNHLTRNVVGATLQSKPLPPRKVAPSLTARG